MSYKNNKIIGSNNPSIRIYLNKKKESHLKSRRYPVLMSQTMELLGSTIDKQDKINISLVIN